MLVQKGGAKIPGEFEKKKHKNGQSVFAMVFRGPLIKGRTVQRDRGVNEYHLKSEKGERSGAL